jgi:hypothetical protein
LILRGRRIAAPDHKKKRKPSFPERSFQPEDNAMKSALTLVLFVAASAFAQNTAPAQARTACGPLTAQFEAQAAAGQPATQLEPGKALVYIAEDFRKAPGEIGNPTLRIGMDGAWVGATRANSYLSFTVEPGEHHLCTSWQSRRQRLSKLAAFAGFTAEPGKVYYFRERITYSSTGGNIATMNLDLEPVNPDEGQFLVASYKPSTSHLK